MGVSALSPRIDHPLATVPDFPSLPHLMTPNNDDGRVFTSGSRYDSGTHPIEPADFPELIPPSNDNQQPGLVSIGAINLSLFGRLAQKGARREPTPLYMKDFERLPGAHGIIAYLRETPLDVVGLSEVWDPEIQRHITRELKDVYPYIRVTPWELGIAAAIRHIGEKLRIDKDNIERASDTIMEKLAQLHYEPSHPLSSLVGAFFNEDIAARIFKRLLRAPQIFGAGLMVLSKHPFVEWDTHFDAFEHHADLDHFTGKGIMNSCISLPHIGEVNFLLSHLQEGSSRKAQEVRRRQLESMRELINYSDFPTIALGDFNIIRETIDPTTANLMVTPEYERMMNILRLRDAYRAIHHNPNRHPGDTYHDGPYARQKGISADTEEYAMAIDYILHDRNFVVVSAVVDRDNFYNPDLEIHNSDHSPLIATIRSRYAPRRIATG